MRIRVFFVSMCWALAVAAVNGCERTPPKSTDRTEKYANGYVGWMDGRTDQSAQSRSLVGELEVTLGDHYVTVRNKAGTWVFPREHLIRAGPNVPVD